MCPFQRAACVIGYPAKHSRSPKVHGYWIKKYAVNGVYRAEEIPPRDVEAFITNLASNGYVGANVTMPHKDLALRLAQPDHKATVIGAANTLWFDEDILRATNTDGIGYINSLNTLNPRWNECLSDAIILGAGGASRAIVHALLEYKIENVHVVNRTFAKAKAIQDNFGQNVHPHDWDKLPELLPKAGLLVNTTSLGMFDQPPLMINLDSLSAKAIVSDIVYIPLKTELLEMAESRGLATTDGLQMLLHQAVLGFELWFGVRPAVTEELYELLALDITAD